VADVPASCELDLVQMPDGHIRLLGFVSKTCGDDGVWAGRSRGGEREEPVEESQTRALK